MQNELVSRVKRSYRLALELNRAPTGQKFGRPLTKCARMFTARSWRIQWPLQKIFSDPASTDLFYGVDNMAKSVIDPAKLDEYRNG